MADWKRVGIGGGVGAVAGVLDQVIQNADEKRGLDARAAGTLPADKKLSVWKQFGTYYDYGIPVASLLAIGMGWLKGDMAMTLATVGGQLAGRKLTHQFTTGAGSNVPSAAYTAWQRAKSAPRSYDPEFDKTVVYKTGIM
jgi:hypothetical protein